LLVVAPPTVQVSAEGLTMAGQEQGMNIYERSMVEVGKEISISLSGTAPPPSAGSASDQGGAPGRAENVQGGDGATIISVPGRLDSLKWPLIGGFAALFVLGALLLARKPVAIAVAVPDGSDASPSANSVVSQPRAALNKNAADAMASIDSSTANSLDALKEQLFRLELRRQAGTITEEDYSRERSKAEQVLRDLVRG